MEKTYKHSEVEVRAAMDSLWRQISKATKDRTEKKGSSIFLDSSANASANDKHPKSSKLKGSGASAISNKPNGNGAVNPTIDPASLTSVAGGGSNSRSGGSEKSFVDLGVISSAILSATSARFRLGGGRGASSGSHYILPPLVTSSDSTENSHLIFIERNGLHFATVTVGDGARSFLAFYNCVLWGYLN
jgi:hypothetical protein